MRLGVLPLAFFLFLVPVLTPILERFWPTSTVWWSAILVALLGAASSAIWLVYRKPLSKAGMPAPSAAPAPVDARTPKPEPQSFTRRWLLG